MNDSFLYQFCTRGLANQISTPFPKKALIYPSHARRCYRIYFILYKRLRNQRHPPIPYSFVPSFPNWYFEHCKKPTDMYNECNAEVEAFLEYINPRVGRSSISLHLQSGLHCITQAEHLNIWIDFPSPQLLLQTEPSNRNFGKATHLYNSKDFRSS